MIAILFEDGLWRICRTVYSATSIIQHKCQNTKNGHVPGWWHISLDDSCVYCRDKVPDPILGLWRLHNWDR